MGKTIELRPGADGFVYNPNPAYSPGDTFLLPEKFTGIYCPVKGTPEAPVIFSNGNRVVQGRDGIDLGDAQNVQIRGDGDSNIQRGIIIDHVGNNSENDAFGIHGYASNILITNVDVRNCAYGIRCKNESSCDPKLNAHRIMDITIQNSKFYNSRFQHHYFGSTNLNGTKRPTFCDNTWQPIPPPQMGNISVLNNNRSEPRRHRSFTNRRSSYCFT